MPAEIRSLADDVIVIAGATSGTGAAAARQLVAAGAKVATAPDWRPAGRDGRGLAPTTWSRSVSDTRLPAEDAAPSTRRRTASGSDGPCRERGHRRDGRSAPTTTSRRGRSIDELQRDGRAVRAAVPAMLEGGGGDIVIVASAAGLRGGADEAVYAGTKLRAGRPGGVARPGLRSEESASPRSVRPAWRPSSRWARAGRRTCRCWRTSYIPMTSPSRSPRCSSNRGGCGRRCGRCGATASPS